MRVDWWRFSAGGLTAVLVAIRGYYARTAGGRRGCTVSEGPIARALRGLIGATFFLVILLHLVFPAARRWAPLHLPGWLRWAGTLLGLASLLLLTWAHRCLGRQFSLDVEIRQEHQLVREGPYRWVRHPMYAAEILLVLALTMVLDDWLMLACAVGSLVFVLMRVPREESALVTRFGAAYVEYMRHSGRFWPRRPPLRSKPGG